MHEHIFNVSVDVQGSWPGFHGWDPEVQIPKAQEMLKEVKDAGYDTIVELSVLGLGRDVNLMAQAVEGSGLQVTLATGVYTYDVLPRMWHFMGPGTLLNGDEPLDELFQRDIEEGIQGTGIKAAFLKCAVDEDGMSEALEKVLRAISRASQRTGRPIMAHSHPANRSGLDEMAIFEDEGVDPRKVQIAHTGDTDDLDYIEELLARGPFIGMDRFGFDIVLSHKRRVSTVAELCRRGYADRMHLSQDAAAAIDWFPPGWRERAVPNWHFTWLFERVLPDLREAGVTEEQIETMLERNPARWLSA